jgi:uncharacterized protein
MRARPTLSLIFSSFLLISCFTGTSVRAQAADQAANASRKTYKEWLKEASSDLKEGKLSDALAAAKAAGQLEPKGYEAPAMAALILAAAHQPAEARVAMAAAMALVPAEKRASLEAMAKKIESVTTDATPAGLPAANLSPEARIKYNALMLIAKDADKATTEADRKKVLREFMAKSAKYLELAPDKADIWAMRAVVAVELDYPVDGFYAGRKLKELGLESSDDAKVQKAFAELERKDWLGDQVKWRDWSKWTTEQATAAANDGDEEAETAMADWYFAGQSGFKRDDVEALNWLRKAADQGDSMAEWKLANAYLNGLGVDKNYVQAANWFRKAADQGNALAENDLGSLYDNGIGVGKDSAEAVNWFRKAVEQDNPGAEKNLGFMYWNGRGVDKDYTEALKWLRKAADHGDSDAENSLGVAYDNGFGVDKDSAQAANWFRKAANQGDAQAERNLGVLYDNGWGVEKDIAQAVAWYRKAGDGGNSDAQEYLGEIYENGRGVDKDFAQALDWYHESASQGNDKAIKRLSLIEGSSNSPAQVPAWLWKSAAQGNAEAQDRLGWMYQNGKDVETNYARALDWFRKSAAQGNSDAQKNEGLMYENGWGVEKDIAQAKACYEKASNQGNQDARAALQRLDKMKATQAIDQEFLRKFAGTWVPLYPDDATAPGEKYWKQLACTGTFTFGTNDGGGLTGEGTIHYEVIRQKYERMNFALRVDGISNFNPTYGAMTLNGNFEFESFTLRGGDKIDSFTVSSAVLWPKADGIIRLRPEHPKGGDAMLLLKRVSN